MSRALCDKPRPPSGSRQREADGAELLASDRSRYGFSRSAAGPFYKLTCRCRRLRVDQQQLPRDEIDDLLNLLSRQHLSRHGHRLKGAAAKRVPPL